MTGITWLHFVLYYIATVAFLRIVLALLTGARKAPALADAIGFIV